MIDRIKLILAETGPRFVAGFTLLPCGLILGYTLSAFTLERNSIDFLRYGPLVLGIVSALLTALGITVLKFLRGKVVYLHFDLFLVAGLFNLVAGGFFLADGFDLIGAFIGFFAHGITFLTSLSYLHAISPKETRLLFLSLSFVWYLIGMASAAMVISQAFNRNTTGTYWDFGWLFMGVSILYVGLLALIRFFHMVGKVDVATSLDEEFRRANSQGTIFESREQVIRRVRDTRGFFYVTENKRWLISFVLLFADAIFFAVLSYFIFWFSLNDAVRLIDIKDFGLIIWIVLLGTITGTSLLMFLTIKQIFVWAVVAQLIVATTGMIVFAVEGTTLSFWLMSFLFGVGFCSIKLSIIETSDFRFTEALILIFYSSELMAIGIVHSLFVADEKNIFFYSVDTSTLMAHGLAFIVIVSMLAIIVSIIMPHTYKIDLFEIQYKVLGIIFTEHHIEQLNIGYLNDGRIPTITPTNM